MIAYIYRPKRQRNGKLVFNRIWRARLKLNGDTKARDISLNCADKQTAEQKLRDITRDHERAAVGLTAPAAQRETFENPMERLVDGYVADLKALGRSADHVRHVDKRLRRLMRECKWQNLREATADSFLRWRAIGGKRRLPKETINEYQAALSAMFSWLRKQGRVLRGQSVRTHCHSESGYARQGNSPPPGTEGRCSPAIAGRTAPPVVTARTAHRVCVAR